MQKKKKKTHTQMQTQNVNMASTRGQYTGEVTHILLFSRTDSSLCIILVTHTSEKEIKIYHNLAGYFSTL